MKGRPYRNPKKGGWHLGVFAHFKPNDADFHGTDGDSMSWDDAVNVAKRESRTDYRATRFKQGPSTPPPGSAIIANALSKEVYGKRDAPAVQAPGRIPVTFTNMDNRCVVLQPLSCALSLLSPFLPLSLSLSLSLSLLDSSPLNAAHSLTRFTFFLSLSFSSSTSSSLLFFFFFFFFFVFFS